MLLNRPTRLLLNLGHTFDHMFLLIFATAVSAIAADFGFERWEDLMPYSAGAFLLFGVGSLPAGRLGDLWGRRAMMIIFFVGIGCASLLAAFTQNAWQMAAALTLVGAFSAIYHPVGIPMLLAATERPGITIGVNGLAGNLGLAAAALITGFFVQLGGWRMAFIAPGVVSIALGWYFARVAPAEIEAPGRRPVVAGGLSRATLVRVFIVMTLTAITGSLLFNLTTNGNAELLRERMQGVVEEPALLGALLAAVYVVAACSQIVVGRLIDRFPVKPLYLCIVLCQAPLLALAAHLEGWSFYALTIGFMVVIFGSIPFVEGVSVRYVDDRIRSRVSGMRLAVSFGVSSFAVWLLGPAVKSAGFDALLLAMAAVSLCTAAFIVFLPPAPAPPPPRVAPGDGKPA
ncbi:MAG: MFS transporter [Burkholderiaceae bacterium]|nr:MFS transporter [Burkholderiaceae bacterium]